MLADYVPPIFYGCQGVVCVRGGGGKMVYVCVGGGGVCLCGGGGIKNTHVTY